jgi:hypothetical protein
MPQVGGLNIPDDMLVRSNATCLLGKYLGRDDSGRYRYSGDNGFASEPRLGRSVECPKWRPSGPEVGHAFSVAGQTKRPER